MTCRMCRGVSLEPFLDLGFSPPADQFRRKDQLREPEVWYPLQVLMCECGLAQLSHVVSPEVLYRNDYPYESSTTRMGREHWDRFAGAVVQRFSLGADDLVVDIGSNVGVLLNAFSSRGVRVQGVDPAANIVLIAVRNGVDTLCDFFNAETVRAITAAKGQASVVTATNVFAHVDDLHKFMRDVQSLLRPGGVFIFEAPYFQNLVDKVEYDTIYHEHLSYLSMRPLVPFFSQFEMEVFHVEFVDIHGGSFRVFVGGRGEHAVTPEVAELLSREQERGLQSPEALSRFALAVEQNRRDLTWLLHSLKHEGKRIAGVSAPAKGMTLINYCRIGPEILDFVTEKAALKIGRFTPGSRIPVVSDQVLLDQGADYALLLAWNFAEEIMSNLSAFRARGGKFIIPIPHPTVIG
ncbi:MAG: class I SAM-dependent methyltransferase [Thermoanaerobaculia bacterium]